MHLIFDAKEYSGSKIAANNSSMDITHSGKMILPGTNETIDVLLCPSAIRNLISGAMLSKIGYTAILNPGGTGKLSKDNININLTQGNGIWIFADFLECHHAKINEIMHRRLGHLGQDNLNILLNPKNKLISNCNFKSANPMCLPCSEANWKALPFGNRDYTQANFLLEIIHTDLAGPMNVLALGGFKYIITFTDDWSRYISVYLLKTKNFLKIRILSILTCQNVTKKKVILSKTRNWMRNFQKSRMLSILTDQNAEHSHSPECLASSLTKAFSLTRMLGRQLCKLS